MRLASLFDRLQAAIGINVAGATAVFKFVNLVEARTWHQEFLVRELFVVLRVAGSTRGPEAGHPVGNGLGIRRMTITARQCCTVSGGKCRRNMAESQRVPRGHHVTGFALTRGDEVNFRRLARCRHSVMTRGARLRHQLMVQFACDDGSAGKSEEARVAMFARIRRDGMRQSGCRAWLLANPLISLAVMTPSAPRGYAFVIH